MNKIQSSLLLLVAFLVGAAVGFYVTHNVWSNSQAMSVLKENGTVVFSKEILEYYSEDANLTTLELEAVTMLSEYSQHTIVQVSNEK